MIILLLIFSQFSTSREFFEISLKKKLEKVNQNSLKLTECHN